MPGKKLNAIDTDQITPATDCVSESLETLDHRWKAGSFRFLMPDFRERVQRGENFVIAGDRFAIGSSREMSPAGLKGVGDEAGHELVIVCGAGMGDIFRRNALNLGLHVVQSRAAVDDAQDGDTFAFDPETRTLTNETQGKSYEPARSRRRRTTSAARAGSSRSAGASSATPCCGRRRSSGPTPRRRAALTSTEQILWAHRVDKDADVRAGRDAARLRRPASRLRRHRAVLDPHLQPDHRR